MKNLLGANRLEQRRRIKAVCFAFGFGLAAVIAIVGNPWWLSGAKSNDPVTQTEPSIRQPTIFEAQAVIGELHNNPASEVSSRSDEATFLPIATVPGASATQLVIPRIGADSENVEVGLTKVERWVPRSVVGHLAETVNAGDIGNAVFAGHVVAGGRDNILARLHELALGDELSFLGGPAEQRFRVTRTRLVPNTDISVLAGRAGASVVTLITCAGRWLLEENDYDQRLIVIAEA